MKRHSPTFVSESNTRFCLYDGCDSSLNEGEYYCIQHGVEALDKWCYTCRDFTGFKYDTWSMGVAGTTNPRWSQVTYAMPGSEKCIECDNSPYGNDFFFLFIFLPCILISLYFLLNTFSAKIAEVYCGIVLVILVVMSIIASFVDDSHSEVIPKNEVEQKIVDELRKLEKNVSTSNLKTVMAHIQGKHLPFRVKLEYDQALTVKEDYDETIS